MCVTRGNRTDFGPTILLTGAALFSLLLCQTAAINSAILPETFGDYRGYLLKL